MILLQEYSSSALPIRSRRAYYACYVLHCKLEGQVLLSIILLLRIWSRNPLDVELNVIILHCAMAGVLACQGELIGVPGGDVTATSPLPSVEALVQSL
jgi:hypothetical protein